MGISNLETSLMHDYKAGVIHLLMCPQRSGRLQHNRCMARGTGRRNSGRTSCFFFFDANSSKGHLVSRMLAYAEMTLSKITDSIILPVVCIFWSQEDYCCLDNNTLRSVSNKSTSHVFVDG